jgi:hypothetical protein
MRIDRIRKQKEVVSHISDVPLVADAEWFSEKSNDVLFGSIITVNHVS